MYRIEIRYPSQPAESRKLSKSRPLSIGRHTSNDICIDDETVATLHCRISWNREFYEVSAGGKDGIDLNGTLVRNSRLKSGDLLRVGPVDIAVTSDEPAADEAYYDLAQDDVSQESEEASQGSEIELKPVTEDQLRSMRRAAESPWKAAVGSQAASSAGSRHGSTAPRKEPMKDDAIIDLGDDDAAAQGIVLKRLQSQGERDRKEQKNKTSEESLESGIVLTRTRSAEEEDAPPPDDESVMQKMKERMRSRPVRPGEEDTIRSPFVLGMGATALFLTLAGAVFWLVIGREQAESAYSAALEQYEQGKFTQSIELFQKFREAFPTDHRAEDALDYLWKSRVEKEISGAAPAWKRGYTTLTDYVSNSHDRPKSDSRTADFRSLSERIATGAAASAAEHPQAAAKPRELLEVAENARKKVALFSGADGVSPDTAARMASEIQRAEAAIRKQETFDSRAASIEQSLADRKPMDALQSRLDLLAEYPEYEKDPKMAALLAKTLETERGLVTREELEQDALLEDRQGDLPLPLSLTMHTRSRTDEISAGRTVFATAADCCYGIDSVTGEPVWRRVIGLDTPFFPITVSTKVPAILMFDTRHAELVQADQRSGKLLWRQPLSEPMSGAPLIHEGQIYVSTLGNHLYKLDLETGRITTKLTFSQMVLSPPALVSDGARLVVAGDKALYYTLTTRPLECIRVTYTAHPAGTITAPLLTMGSLILVSEGSTSASSKLRVLDVRDDGHWLNEVAQGTVEGQLRDAPVIRGKELFVSSSGERITAFTISDDAGQRPLTQIASVQVQTPHPGPMFLSPGPDGQLWMAGSAVRKLQLKTESIKLDPTEVAAGMTSQPLQDIGQYLYAGRRLPFSSAVLFTQADRESMTGLWRVVLGSRILAVSAANDGRVVCLTEGGEIYQASASEIQQGGFKRTSNAQLKIPDDLSDPLAATTLADGRIAAYCSGSKPQLWIVSLAGQVEGQFHVDQPLETSPVQLADGIVLPMSGKLRMLRPASPTAKVEDYLVTTEKQGPARWQHLLGIDESNVAAIDDKGRLVRVQYRTAPLGHLAEVAVRQLDSVLHVPPVLFESHLFVSDANGQVQQLDATSLETQSTVDLKAPASGVASVIGGRLFVELAGGRLACVDIRNECKLLWVVPLSEIGLAGPPIAYQGHLVAALRDGQVLVLDVTEGKPAGKLDVGQPLGSQPLGLEKSLLIPSIDGSFYHLDELPKK